MPKPIDSIRILHPSLLLLLGPLTPAAAIFLGGAYRGGLRPEQTAAALFLLVTTYLVSRWFRRSAVRFDADGITAGERTLRYDDADKMVREPGPIPFLGPDRIVLSDRNGVPRITLIPVAYGATLRQLLGTRQPSLRQAVTPSRADRTLTLLWPAASIAGILGAVWSFL